MSDLDLNLQKVVCGHCGRRVSVAYCAHCGCIVEEGDALDDSCPKCRQTPKERDWDAEYHRRAETITDEQAKQVFKIQLEKDDGTES